MTDRARPGLVAFYDIRPGNRAGLFLQPRSPHGATVPYGEGILPPSTEAPSGPKQQPELTFRTLIGKHTQSIAHVYIQTMHRHADIITDISSSLSQSLVDISM